MTNLLLFGFVGRARETAQLRRLYVQRKHVLIVGPAGIGKTTLLRQVSQNKFTRVEIPPLTASETHRANPRSRRRGKHPEGRARTYS